MKKILLLTGVVALLATTGCLFPGGGPPGHARGHERYEPPAAVIVGPPVVEVRPPMVEVRPPAVIVR